MTAMTSAARISMFITLLLIWGGSSAFAQFSSGIEGTATESTGAVLAKATVTLTDTRLGVNKTTTTDQAGYFRFDSIGASTYDVQVQSSGFKSWQLKGLVLQPGEIRTLAPVLQVGSVSANVEVSASVSTVDLETPTTGSVISELTVQQAPLMGQNAYALAALTPGITGAAVTSTSIDNYTNAFTININAAGLRQEQNGYMVDDAYVNEPSRGGGATISPIPDTIQSMDIKTNDFDAQKGRDAGAIVDIYTLSGSNDFHGTFNYYFTNSTLTADKQS